MALLRKTCREVTALVLQGQDRPLRPWERLGLHLHWLACAGCRRFRRQAGLMQQAMGGWRRYRDD
ncbi:zf-HC2 domain-containing protein [Ideonella sp. DXS22W]|uniref:Zf-HC2 domain-containing protein n=1 Tax=Pseudaquabacterium inlustre TaxID=2984192 RepID=A0ABU9CC39_9BURK